MNPPFFIPVTHLAGIGNTIKGFISALAISDDVKIRCNRDTVLGNFDRILEPQFIIQDETDIQGRDIFSSCRFLILKEEEEYQRDLPNEYSSYTTIDLSSDNKYRHLFSQKVMIDWYYDRKLIHDKVFERIQNGIKKIVWKTEIIEEVNRTVASITFPALGVSVRTWNGHHPGDRGCTRQYNKEAYLHEMSQIVDTHPTNTIFMSYDNSEYSHEYADFLKNHQVVSYTPSDEFDLLQIAIVKILILAKCDYFVCNRQSTYAELVFWFNGCEQIVRTVF